MLQSSTSESSVSVSSNTNLSTVSSQRVSASSTTNLSTASSMTNVSSQQATTSTKGRRAKVLVWLLQPFVNSNIEIFLRWLCQTLCVPPAIATTLPWSKTSSESLATSPSHPGIIWSEYILLITDTWLAPVFSSVTASTTHVISGEGKRTLNLLKGLMQVFFWRRTNVAHPYDASSKLTPIFVFHLVSWT